MTAGSGALTAVPFHLSLGTIFSVNFDVLNIMILITNLKKDT
jgi:hypothetical protein